MSKMSEQDVIKMWGGPDDFDLEKIQYRWDAPLYEKMLWRFRQNNGSPFAFCHSCDPSNMLRPLDYYNIYNNRNKDLIEFFAWIKNGMGIIDFYDLFDANMTMKHDQITEIFPYKNWKVNEIVFFLNLTVPIQEKIIDKYNINCVDSYNRLYSK
jgi:hypothetical protein